MDIKHYVENGLENGTLVLQKAEKFARIVARQGRIGEMVSSYTNGILETVNCVELDPKTNQPGWVATKVVNGEIFVDEWGHMNQWIISDSTFKKKYEVDLENPVLFKPKGGIQTFVKVSEDIVFVAPWGEEMHILRGGYLNITDMDDIYGIQESDFFDTYRFVGEKGLVKHF